jgi:DNA primase
MPTYHVKEFVRDAFSGRARISGNGIEVNVPCPFHDDWKDKKHLYVNLKTGMWICFKCDAHGGFPNLVREMLNGNANTNLHFGDYVIYDDSEETGDGLLRLSVRPAQREKKSYPFPEGYLPVWVPTTTHEVLRAEAVLYLTTRGVDFVAARLYEIGFAPTGRLGHRVIVPVRAADERLVGWVARDTTGQSPIKILSSSNEEDSIRNHVFNLNRAQHAAEIVVVEGVFDAIRHGTNFVALLGKLPTEQQVASIIQTRMKAVRSVTVLLDRDAPREGRTLAKRLSMHLPDVRWAHLPRSKDPGEAPETEVHEALMDAKKIS